MKLKYNAPTTLTFTLICAVVLMLNYAIPGLTENWFSVSGKGGFNPASFRSWITLFTHVIGHVDINHFLSNFSFILLLGPILEASYGSVTMLIMMSVTALITGILNILIFPTGLLGASGIVFMMILLSSFTNFNKGELPLTFILVMVLYLGKEVINAFSSNSVSEFAHIMGGLCGSIFGYIKPRKR